MMVAAVVVVVAVGVAFRVGAVAVVVVVVAGVGVRVAVAVAAAAAVADVGSGVVGQFVAAVVVDDDDVVSVVGMVVSFHKLRVGPLTLPCNSAPWPDRVSTFPTGPRISNFSHATTRSN